MKKKRRKARKRRVVGEEAIAGKTEIEEAERRRKSRGERCENYAKNRRGEVVQATDGRKSEEEDGQ